MRVLLINTNPVVSRLMRLCIKDEHALLDEVSSLDNLNEPYDIVFIDDIMYGEISHETLQNIERSKLVLFSAQKDIEVPSFIDEVIKKPFLPSRVIEVIESVDELYPHTPETAVQDEEEVSEDISIDLKEHDNQILDINEIEKIKSLLETNDNEEEVENEPVWEDDQELEKLKREVIKQNLIDEGLEIVEEDVMNAIEPDLAVHITHDINDPSRDTFESELLNAIQKMKVKKLKKLLKGAQITINIRFKDDNE